MSIKKIWWKSIIEVNLVDGKYLWTVVVKPYGIGNNIISLSSTEPIKNEGRARLSALKWLLKYLAEENDQNVYLIVYYRNGESYEKYVHNVITQSIKWWVDKWHLKNGDSCMNIDLLKEIVPLLIPVFDRITTASITDKNIF